MCASGTQLAAACRKSARPRKTCVPLVEALIMRQLYASATAKLKFPLCIVNQIKLKQSRMGPSIVRVILCRGDLTWEALDQPRERSTLAHFLPIDLVITLTLWHASQHAALLLLEVDEFEKVDLDSRDTFFLAVRRQFRVPATRPRERQR